MFGKIHNHWYNFSLLLPILDHILSCFQSYSQEKTLTLAHLHTTIDSIIAKLSNDILI